MTSPTIPANTTALTGELYRSLTSASLEGATRSNDHANRFETTGRKSVGTNHIQASPKPRAPSISTRGFWGINVKSEFTDAGIGTKIEAAS